MPTISVLDAEGNPVDVELPNADGRQSAANSRPVALSTDDLAAIQLLATAAGQAAGNTALENILNAIVAGLAISSSALPTGAATAALQGTGNTTLTQILSAINTGLTIGSSALPAGAATAANQATGNTALADILTALTSPLEIVGGVTISDWSQLVDLMRAAPQPVVDGGADYVWVPRGVLSTGSVQTIAAPNANRRAFYLSNPATVNQYYRVIGGDASIGGVGSDLLVPGAWRLWSGKACPKGAVTVICGEAGRAITAYEA